MLHSACIIVLESESMLHIERASGPLITTRALDGIHDLWQAQARATPDRTAVVVENRRVAYRTLERRANQLARDLRRRGVEADVPVAILLERSLDVMVALLGTMKAGGAYVPLLSNTPAARVRFVLEDSGARVVLTERSLAHLAPDADAVVRLDDDWCAIARESSTPIAHGAGLRNLAYIIYTSGSTGEPKGVRVEHGNLLNLAFALRETIFGDAIESRRISLNAPLAFDSSVKQWIQLVFGHTLYVIPERVRRDAATLLSFAADHDLDVLDCTPTLLRRLIDAGLLEAEAPRTVLVGGEAIDPALWTTLTADTRRTFINLYGPTECTVDVSVGRVAGRRPHIGTPLPHCRTYVLDRRASLVSPSRGGELYVGGGGVAAGYHRRPALTAEHFLPDPFGGAAGDRVYRTGDLARQNDDGSLEFLGRCDDQVKIKGCRVELGEIEAVLARHPAIHQAAAVVCGDAIAPRLVACITSRTIVPPDPQEIRAYLDTALPRFMTPAAVLVLDALPVTAHGKLDRLALRTRASEAVRGLTTPATAGVMPSR